MISSVRGPAWVEVGRQDLQFVELFLKLRFVYGHEH